MTASVLSLFAIYFLFVSITMLRQHGSGGGPELISAGCANALFVPMAAAQWLAILKRNRSATDYVVLVAVAAGGLASLCLIVTAADASAAGFINAAIVAFCFWTAWANYRWLIMLSQPGPRHLCSFCGYDLRATSDPSGTLLPRCPECGQAPPEADL